MDARASLAAALKRLTAGCVDGRPDGRPLHAYRMSREDFELARKTLRAAGLQSLVSIDGGALFVAFAAEWFRRDRVGGHWDWKRPLREIGLVYGQDDPAATVGYAQIVTAVENGLRWWRRPAVVGGDRVIAVVKEAGFPAAALRDNRRVTDWLRNAVRLIERGFDPLDAVGSESWRMNHSRIAEATFDAAVELSVALVALRRLVKARGEGDPITTLDAVKPEWRADLPFELEPQDVAAVIESVIRAPPDGAFALFATRHLRRREQGWVSSVTLALSGPLDPRRLPWRVVDALSTASRMRITPRGELIGAAGALAAVERRFDEDPESAEWRARPLVVDFEPQLPLDVEVRLGAIVGEELVDEFLAYAGEGLAGEVVVLEPAQTVEPDACDELLVLGCSSVRSRKAWLALAVAEADAARLVFDGEHWDLGVCGARRLVAFAGSATFVAADGARTTWRSAADRTDAPRLVLSGRTVRRLREIAFRGLPSVWVDLGDLLRECRSNELRWRPVGRGAWRSVGDGPPFGRISIGLFDRDGDLRAFTNAIVLPEEVELIPARQRKGLVLKNTAGARLAARGPQILAVSRETTGAFVDLSTVDPGRVVELSFGWEASAEVTLSNPITPQALIDPSGAVAPGHHRLAIGRLHGYRMVTAEPGHLSFDLVAGGGPRRSFTRRIHAEAPLVGFLEDLRNLLGTSDDLDAAVRLSWIGEEGWTCEIRWYDLDPGSYEDAERQAFGVTRTALLGIQNVQALSVTEPSVGVCTLAVGGGRTLTRDLEDELQGPPWLVFGSTAGGKVLRPRIVDSGRREASAASALAEAIGVRTHAERLRRLTVLAASPADWTALDRRRWLDLATVAARTRLPYAALDPLCVLDRDPSAAVWLLAFADSADEQRAVLALQRDLPMLWACTPVAPWIDAFEARAADLDAHLKSVGVDISLASSVLLTSIGQLADLAPVFAPRLQAVLLYLFAGGRRPCPAGSYDLLAERLARMLAGLRAHELGEWTNQFVQRHADGPPPPRGLGLASRIPAAGALVDRFDPVFGDVIAAPFSAAAAAFAPGSLDRPTLGACRAAWLFDPEHFDMIAALLVADWRAAGGPPRILETAK